MLRLYRGREKYPGLVCRKGEENMETITLEDAKRVVAAAERKAADIGCPMDIAVVDGGGNLKAFVRMDDAFLGRPRERPGWSPPPGPPVGGLSDSNRRRGSLRRPDAKLMPGCIFRCDFPPQRLSLYAGH